MQPQGPQKVTLPGVKHVIAVASGKGGVGKSTVATNLALALHMLGRRVGLLDADIYGPSIPIMMGVPGVFDPNTTAFPLDRYGIKLMSMGFLVKPETAMIWRGPMVHKYLTAFLTQIDWGQLDYLVIDPRVAECGDTGDPIVHKHPDSGVAKAYLALAGTVAEQIGKAGPQEELPTLQL